MYCLYEFLREVPDFRKPWGVRHRLAMVLTIALAGKMAGIRGVMVPGEFAGRAWALALDGKAAPERVGGPNLERVLTATVCSAGEGGRTET